MYSKSKSSVLIVLSPQIFRNERVNQRILKAGHGSPSSSNNIRLEFWNILEAEPIFTNRDIGWFQDSISVKFCFFVTSHDIHKIGTSTYYSPENKAIWASASRTLHYSHDGNCLSGRRVQIFDWSSILGPSAISLTNCAYVVSVSRMSPNDMVTNEISRQSGRHRVSTSWHGDASIWHMPHRRHVILILWVRYNWHGSHSCFTILILWNLNMDVMFSTAVVLSEVRRCDASLQKGGKTPSHPFPKLKHIFHRFSSKKRHLGSDSF